MSAKTVYRKLIYGLERIPAGVTTAKVWVGEWYDILRKRKLYRHIKWTREQKKEFDIYWKTHYGKKISTRWHKLYQSINDTFNVAYIPEILYTTKLEPKGNDYYYAKVLQDKNLVELLADGVNVVTPKTILACCDGKLHTGDYRCVSEAEAENLLSPYEWIVMKPTSGGSSGKGVEVMNLQKDGFHLTEWIHQYKGNFIIQEAVHQHEALARLNPTSVNTLRITTYRTEDGVHTAPHCLRMGQGKSCVDNIHAGGLGIHVREDGTLNCSAYELGYCDKKIRYEQHPDTHIHFENYQIPYVDKIAAEAKKMHLKLPHIRFASWDFTINDQNQIVLIEVNLKGQGIWFPQVISGQSLFGVEDSEIKWEDLLSL
jgi:hypothetical protein